VIRLLTVDDAEELAALYLENRDFLLPFEPEREDDFFTAAHQRTRIEAIGDDLWRWAIVDDGRIAGMIAIADVIRGGLQLGNVGYWVARIRNGRGLATAAVSDVIEFAFGQAALHRLEAGTLVDNHASQRVLEKNGFERYGLARKLLKINGEWRDHVLYERIAD
jgi:[ribosomal protein S5]-alanine N-acetyltransferase